MLQRRVEGQVRIRKSQNRELDKSVEPAMRNEKGLEHSINESDAVRT